MIVGDHITLSAYGFWLPNDPRGSWSDFVGAWELYLAGGRAKKPASEKSVARVPHDWRKRLAAKTALARPPVRFSDAQVRAVADGFGNYVAKSGLSVWACAVMPDHVHLLTGRFRITAERVANQMKGAATEALVAAGVHPFREFAPPGDRPPACFGVGQWTVFLGPDDVEPAARYVEDNPVKAGLPPQHWPFVTKPKAIV